MKEQESSASSNALDPVSRISEILFGLIMVLSFTSSIRATSLVREDVREILLGALGCNLAWGIIDSVMFLMTVIAERARENRPLLVIADFWQAFIVFALVFLTIFPVSIPFLVMHDVERALRVSNLIALLLLFGLGYKLGSHVNRSPVRWGLGMAVTGALLVMVAIQFGG